MQGSIHFKRDQHAHTHQPNQNRHGIDHGIDTAGIRLTPAPSIERTQKQHGSTPADIPSQVQRDGYDEIG